ncbi:1596_t:CDS:2 [Entrophospora sp. SA101]|nr:1596_t:CDS:2 [Entrophospora sp. SA101]
MNDGIQKVDISSSLSFNIPTTQQSFDYDATIEDYSPSLDEDIEEVNHPFQRCSNYDRRSPDSLFKRRHSRRSLAMMNDGIQKVDISSSLSFNIPTTQQSFDYDATIEDYSPSLDEDIEE